MSQFLKDLSLRIKIMLPVAILSVMMIVIGFVGLYSSIHIMDQSTSITEVFLKNTEVLGDIRSNYQSLRRVAFAHIIAIDSNNATLGQNLEKEGDELRGMIATSVDEYKKNAAGYADAQSQADTFVTDFNSYMEVWDAIIKNSQEHKIAKASELANTSLREKGSALTETLAAMSENLKSGEQSATKSQLAAYSSGRTMIIVFLSIAVIIMMFTIWVTWKWCVKRLININKQLRGIIKTVEDGQGDLTKRVQCFCTDEVGNLAAGINIFIETLHRIMGQINVSSTQLGNIVKLVSGKVDTANNNSVDISAVMEELSASMEEISSTVSDIKNSVNDVDENIVVLSNESQDLYSYANEMQKRAEELEQNAVENRENTGNVINEIVQSLEKAIEDSKSVDKVNDLTNEILSISSQTNLLSLNASIEAARAGEAGRGFAVVADEISQLANSSREAASNIQNINNMVVRAVNELIESSDNMVKYINENVLPDYENFVDTGRRYSEDAVHVNEIVTRFNEMSEQLKRLMDDITDAVTGITAAVDESANGVTTAAMDTSDLVKGIGEISAAMDDNKEIAGTLEDEADRFINLDQ